MRVLVLGSDGQIGKPLVAHLQRGGHIVTGFDNYSDPAHDLRLPRVLDSLLPEIDFVFFLAFDVGGAVYLKHYQDTYDFMSNNIRIMNNTFDSLRRWNTPFVFASSQMSEMSHSTYGILKLIGERYTRECNGTVARFWNVYGPEKDTDKAHVITHFISMARRGDIHMRTTGEEMRQFLYVDDCCECLEMMMTLKENFDVSSFEWVRIKDLALMVAREYGCGVIVGGLVDDVQRSELKDPSRDVLKYWQPRTTLEAGIKHMMK